MSNKNPSGAPSPGKLKRNKINNYQRTFTTRLHLRQPELKSLYHIDSSSVRSQETPELVEHICSHTNGAFPLHSSSTTLLDLAQHDMTS